MKKLLVFFLFSGLLGAEMGNFNKWTPSGTQANRPMEFFPTFAKDEICDYPKPYVDGVAKAEFQANVYSRWPASAACPSGSVRKSWVWFHYDNTAGTTYKVDYRNSPSPCHLPSAAACDAAAYDQAGLLARTWEATMEVAPYPASAGATTRVPNARSMIAAGKWTKRVGGPLVTQVIVEDRTTARSEDFGWREKRSARVTTTLQNDNTSFAVAADWSTLTRPFKVMVDYEIVSICYVSYTSATGISILTVGTTNGTSPACATFTGRAQLGTGAGYHYANEVRTLARLYDESGSALLHVSGLESNQYSTSITVNNAASINDVTFLKARFEIIRICNKSGNVLTVGTGSWGCAPSGTGRTWWGSRHAVKIQDGSTGGGYPANFSFDNWSTLNDVWTDASSDNYKSLHPVFVLTFWNNWPAIGIEYHITNTWSDRLQDQYYSLTLKRRGNTVVTTIPDVTQKAMTMWKYPDGPVVGTYTDTIADRKVWDGTTPIGVKYDFNLPYLRYTGVIASDPNLKLDQSALDMVTGSTNRYTSEGQTFAWENSDKGAIPRNSLWANANHRTNCVYLTKEIPMPGGRGDIAPLPLWYVTGLYAMNSNLSGADKWYEAMFGVASCQGSIPLHVWEGDIGTSRKFCYDTNTTVENRSCTNANATVPAFGYPWSIDSRPTACLTFNQGCSDQDPYEKLMMQGDQGLSNWNVGYGPTHWPVQNFVPWLLSGDWYYERGSLDEGAFIILTSSGSHGSRKDSWGIFNPTSGSRSISWSIRSVALSMWTAKETSPEFQYFENKLKTWAAINEGRYNITNGLFYAPCADVNDKTSTKWCYGRRTVERDAATKEGDIPFLASFCCWWVPSDDQGNVMTGWAQMVQSDWMENFGIISAGWAINMGFADFLKPIYDRVYARDRVERILDPSLPTIFTNGEYRSPGTPCRPEGAFYSPDCRNVDLDGSSNLNAGVQRRYTSRLHWWNSWNNTAKAKNNPDNDQDKQGGYWSVYHSAVMFSERVRTPSGLTGTRAIEKVRQISRYREGKTEADPQFTFTPQMEHSLDVRAYPSTGGNLTIVFRAPNGGACSYLISSGYPNSSLDDQDVVVPVGATMRTVVLSGQTPGSKTVRVTCGNAARGIAAYTQN